MIQPTGQKPTSYQSSIDTAGKSSGLDVLGIPGTNGPDIKQSGLPEFDFNTYPNMGQTNTWMPLWRTDETYTFTQNLSITHGAHEFRFGFDALDFGCALEVSGDAGGTFVPANPVPTLPPGAEKCYGPEVAFDRKGTLYFLFVGLRGTGNTPMGVFLTSSSDRASKAIAAAAPGTTWGTNGDARPRGTCQSGAPAVASRP